MRPLKEKKPRAYQLRARADKQAATHQALAKAAYELHSTVGPAKTTISAIADRAGVQRLTVYRHFSDQDAIFAACIAHAYEQDAPPNPQAWAPIADPEIRLRAALTTTYGYYRRNHQLLANVYRDAEVPAVAKRLARSTEMQVVSVAVLDVGWTGGDARIRAAALGHSLDFSAWQSLTRTQGLSDAQAVEAMIAFVKAMTRPNATISAKLRRSPRASTTSATGTAT